MSNAIFTAIFSKLLLDYVVFTNMTLTWVQLEKIIIQ